MTEKLGAEPMTEGDIRELLEQAGYKQDTSCVWVFRKRHPESFEMQIVKVYDESAHIDSPVTFAEVSRFLTPGPTLDDVADALLATLSRYLSLESIAIVQSVVADMIAKQGAQPKSESPPVHQIKGAILTEIANGWLVPNIHLTPEQAADRVIVRIAESRR